MKTYKLNVSVPITQQELDSSSALSKNKVAKQAARDIKVAIDKIREAAAKAGVLPSALLDAQMADERRRMTDRQMTLIEKEGFGD